MRGRPRRVIRPASAIATTSANISSILSAGRTSTRSRASSSPALAKACMTPGATSTTSPGPAMDRAQPDAEAHPAGDDLEALGLDRVDVRDRDGAAGAQREVEREELAAGAWRPCAVKVKRSPVTGFSSVWPGVIMVLPDRRAHNAH